jgi:hypothetical protein
MASRIFLHVGRHKTGTTQIQRFLKLNQPLLAKKNIDYPMLREEENAHHSAANYLKSKNAPTFSLGIKRLSAFYRREKSKPDAVPQYSVERGKQDSIVLSNRIENHDGTSILSSEVFQDVRPSMTRALVGGTMTDVIIYLREQASYVVSAYCQNVVGNLGTCSFSEYLPHFRSSVNYVKFVDGWVREFGASATTLRVFDRSVLVGSDIRRDFASVLELPDLDSFEYTSGPDVDLFGGDILELLRRLNLTGQINMNIRPAIVEEMRRLARVRPDLGGKPKISVEGTRDIQSSYAEQNKKLFAKFHIQNAQAFPVNDQDSEALDPAILLDNPKRQFSKLKTDEIIDLIAQSRPDLGDCLASAWAAASTATV